MGSSNLGVIVVRVCEPVFRNLPHSYTWPLKKMDPFIYLAVRNVDLFIYCTLIFIAGSHINMAVNSLKQPRKISERKIYAYTGMSARGCQKSGAYYI